MKKILLTIIIALTTIATQAQWVSQNVPLTYTGFINDIRAIDANIVWGNPQNATATPAVATRNFVRTVDGGVTWKFAVMTGTPTNHRVSNMFPIDSSVCYSAMYNSAVAGGGVFKTVNGGVNWAKVGPNMYTTATSFPDLVYFWDAQNGVTVGDPDAGQYEIYTTNDSGSTWVRVPSTNLPTITDPAEFGITNLYGAADGRIWFGTTYGDIYRSLDSGYSWTKSATGFTPFIGSNGRQDIANVTFCDSIHGLLAQVDSFNVNLISTNDGGLTWAPLIPTGPFFTDFSAVRNSPIIVSAGSNSFGFGTSFSLDYGATWNLLDTNASHTSIDFPNDSVGFSGRFINLGTGGGAWKYNSKLQIIPCGSPLISAGVTTVNSIDICFGDTLTSTNLGALAPSKGVVHGFSMLFSSADISGNSDPLGTGFVLAGTGTILPSTPITLVNDNISFPVGTYYLTSVVYGNATDPGATNNVTAYLLDPNCTVTGTSILVNLLGPGAPGCSGVGIVENNPTELSLLNLYPVPVNDILNFTVNSKTSSVLNLSVQDVLGREVYSNAISVNSGNNKISIPTQNLSNAVYVISVSNGQSKSVAKFVKE